MKLNDKILAQKDKFVSETMPVGKWEGKIYKVEIETADIPMRLTVDFETGNWVDQETERQGKNLIELFAYLNGITVSAANRQLKDAYDDSSDFLPPSEDQIATLERLGIRLTKGGKPTCNLDNTLRAIENHQDLKGLFWYDTFHQKIMTNRGSDHAREWNQSDTLELTIYLQRTLGMSGVSVDTVWSAIQAHGYRNQSSEPLKWMQDLVWDGEKRIDEFFYKYMGTTFDEYHMAVSRSMWISMVARVFEPGCKVDTMPVLEGEQGTRKSTALNVIAGRWFAEAAESPTSKDFFAVLQGQLIVEIAELDSFNRSEIQTIKRVITCQKDRYRVPYERAPQDFPRTCILTGTTNESEYLRDSTGARRFLPVRVIKIDIEKLKRDRDQLFAEAVSMYKSGLLWYDIFPETATKSAQEQRRQHDEWESEIGAYLLQIPHCTISNVAAHLGIEMKRLDKSITFRIGKILRMLKWESRSERLEDGTVAKVWRPVK